ncbi:Mfa1 family fimbria major subunit [Bacteroides reticulotermitis]|uniref:Mfa1 family fimbria major subunit n=1 Tax=Bacteroides reticulotermitis TaxID=1133319 RepID=UPI003A881E7E
MNLKSSFLLGMVALGLNACTNDSDLTGDQGNGEGDPTYITLSVSLPSMGAQRLASISGTDTRALPEDYNPDGDYEGHDAVETLDVYMMSIADRTVETHRFTGSQITSTGSVVSTSQPFKTTSGRKQVHIVLNSPSPLTVAAPTDNELMATAGLARMKTVSGKNYDVIMMTGSGVATIEPDITVQEVANGANRVSVMMTRTASRAIVTTSASPDIKDANGVTLGTLSNLTYSVVQGTNKIYFMSQANYVTWGFDYVPIASDYATTASTYYDYSDLSTPSAIPAKPVAADGYKELPGKFLFENTHTLGENRASHYKKGNTAYILVRGKFTPIAAAIADGGALVNGTFYVGQTDGKIYSSKSAAQTAVQNQKVSAYEKGKMLYFAWLNPDNIQSPYNSPVLRNNIYHVNINSFARLGMTWNPLYPEDPNTTNPANPDPKPLNPEEPENPISPIDPLTVEHTYMTVDVSVLNWTVHSYDVDF